MMQTAPNTIPAPPPTVVPRLRVGKLCVAIQAATAEELITRANAALQSTNPDSKFIELRLDALAEPTAALPAVKELLARQREATIIATCRRKPFGGNFAQSLSSELDVLLKAAQSGCQIVDLEIESAEEAKPAQLSQWRDELRAAGAALLVSFHDFKQTGDLEQAEQRIEAFRPDFVKVVSTAQSLADNLAVLKLIQQHSGAARVVGIAMGEEGIVSRVLGPRAGAAFTFASSADGPATAPGQVSGQVLRDLYRASQLDQATRIFGVAGDPIAHSFSPLMQNTAFRRQGVNAVLLPLKTRSLDDLLALVRGLPLAGVAVTMPLKQEVLPYLANMDPLTSRIGACNTLRIGTDGKIIGFNTDVAGIVRPLEKRIHLKGARIAILGAGGAARAAAFGLVAQGAEVCIVNRTHENAVKLAAEAKATTLKHELLAKNHFDVLINSTPCGMAGNKQKLPLAEDELNAGLVFDMVYNPLETPLLKLAKTRGIPVITGLEMFVQQGARQFEIWTGQPAPEAEMLHVVELALRKRG